MLQRKLLGLCATVMALPLQAAPFMPMDARGIAMGGTGVASSQMAHTVRYNPSLLSQMEDDDDFELLLPTFGFNIADEEGIKKKGFDLIDAVKDRAKKLADKNRSDSIQNLAQGLSDAASDLSSEMANISDLKNISNPLELPTKINEKANALQAANNKLKTSKDALDRKLDDINAVVKRTTDGFTDISEDTLRGRMAAGAALAFTGKKLGVGVYIGADTNISANIVFTQQDSNLVNAYGQAAKGMVTEADLIPATIDELITTLRNVASNPSPTSLTSAVDSLRNKQSDIDNITNFSSADVNTAGGTIKVLKDGKLSEEAKKPKLSSSVQMAGIAVAEAGVSLSHEFRIAGQKVAIGVTPKFQKIETFHIVSQLTPGDDASKKVETALKDNRRSYNDINLDIGASLPVLGMRRWLVGVSVINILGGEYETAEADVLGSEQNVSGLIKRKGPTLSIDPQIRIGTAYNGSWFSLAADLDLLENKPVAFEKPTQYFSLGAELDVFNLVQLRTGYRTNLALANSGLVSLGLGLSPLVPHLDIAFMTSADAIGDLISSPGSVKTAKKLNEGVLALEFGLAF